MKAPEWPRRIGGIRPLFSGFGSSGSAASAAAADASPGPGSGRRYSGSSRGAMFLPRAVGKVVRARVEGVVDGLDHALRAPEAVAHLGLRRGTALLAGTDHHQGRRAVEAHTLGDPGVAGHVLRPRDEDGHPRIARERLDGPADEAIVDAATPDDQE